MIQLVRVHLWDQLRIALLTARHGSYRVPSMYSIDSAHIGFIPSRWFIFSVGLCFGGFVSVSFITVPLQADQHLTSSYPISDDQDQDNIPNWEDLDDDNDGILDSEEGHIELIDRVFDSVTGLRMNRNNIGVDISPWICELPLKTNVIMVDGIGGGTYVGGGPQVDARGGAGNYFDIAGTSTIYQSFDLAKESIVVYSAFYSARDGKTNVGGGEINLLSGGGLSGATVSTIANIVASDMDAWDFFSDTTILPAGTYTIQVVLANPQNIDEVILATILDTDEDGIPNHLDLDSDGDGIPDLIEAGGVDVDGDGMVDYETSGDPLTMTDADADGVADAYDVVDSGSGAAEYTSGTSLSRSNTDGAGAEDFQDIDSDDDGIVDNTEAQGSFLYVAPSGSDTDGDGIDDAYDADCQPCGGITGISIIPVDSDNDGQPDFQDLDSDADGFPDSIEGHDTNGDGLVDEMDSPSARTGLSGGGTDEDEDGLLDGYDNDPERVDATNGNLNASSHPDVYGVTSERDWREQFILPVEWIRFFAVQNGKTVYLSWALSSGSSVDHFMIERSTDGLLFEAIGRVEGDHVMEPSSGYSFADSGLPPGDSLSLLYRIRLIDLNGSEQVSNVLEWVTTASSHPLSLKAFPNPAQGTLSVLTRAQGPVTLRIFSASGTLIYTSKWDQQSLEYSQELDISMMPSGVYNITLLQHEEQATRSFRVMRQ